MAAAALTGVAVLAVLGALVAWPVTSLAVHAAGRGLLDPRAGELLAATLALAATSTVVMVALAIVLALAAARGAAPGHRGLATLAVLALLGPPPVGPLAVALARGAGAAALAGFPGLVVAQVLTFLPLAFVLLRAAIAAVDPDAEAAAESLGASGGVVVRRITLALVWTRVVAVVAVVYVLTAADFVTPFVLGARVLTTEIYARAIEAGDRPAAAALALLLLLPCLLAVAVGGHLVRRQPSIDPAGSGPRTAGPPARAALAAVSVVMLAAVAAAYAAVVAGALVERAGGRWSLTGRPLALGSSLWAAVASSAELALAAGAATVVLALTAASVAARGPGPLRRPLEWLGFLPAGLPAGALGLGMLLAFGPGRGTAVAAVVAGALPLALLLALTAVRRMEPALEEAAVTLGAGRLTTARRITAPLLARPALAIVVQAMVGALVTAGAVIFVAVPGRPPAAVAALVAAAGGDLGRACALTTIVLAAAAVVAGLGRALGGGPGRVAGQ